MNSSPLEDSFSSTHPVSILVISCDKYSDLWRPFFDLFWGRWPDCPYLVYLGTNLKTYSGGNVISIPVGDDRSWASSVLRMLAQIRTRYVILFLEDFLIQRNVDTSVIRRYVEIAVDRELGCLRLIPYPPPSRSCPDFPELGTIMPGDLYRVSTQVAIWRVETLRRLLIPGFSAWDFELTGSQLSNTLTDPFWCVWEPAIFYVNGVERGKWRPQGFSLCLESNIEVDLAFRPVLTEEEIDSFNRMLAIDNLKYDSLSLFLAGKRIKGLISAVHYLFKKPFSLHLWGIVIFGMLGPRSLSWLKSKHLRARMEQHSKKWGHAN